MFDCWNRSVVTCQISEPVGCRSNLTAAEGELPFPRIGLCMPTVPTIVHAIWRIAARLEIGQFGSLFNMAHLYVLVYLVAAIPAFDSQY